MSIYGTNVPSSEWRPLRSIIASPEVSASGNVILRVGREHPTGGWEQTEYVVLTAVEASELAELVIRASLGQVPARTPE